MHFNYIRQIVRLLISFLRLQSNCFQLVFATLAHKMNANELPMQEERTYIAIDLKSFYASVDSIVSIDSPIFEEWQ